KIAMQTLGISMSKFALVGGGAFAALTALVTVVGLVASAQAEARAKAQAYADTFQAGTTRITKATRDMAAEALAAKNSFLWMEKDSAYDAAEKLGISLELVTDAASGNVKAMEELQKQIDAGADGSLAYANSAVDIENAVRGEAASLEEAIRVAKQKAKATEDSIDPMEEAAAATEALAAESQAADEFLSDMAESLEDVGGAAMDMGSAVD